MGGHPCRATAEMKRWIVILLITLAVILLLSPGVVGRLAERNLDENLGWIEQESDDIVVTSEGFDRGWFTSEGRHRVSLREDSLLAGLGDARDASTEPTLVIHTRLDHGLVPFTSMQRERGSLRPGLASSVSTLSLDDGAGNTIDLPGKVYTTIAIDGTSSFRYLLDAGSREIDGQRWSWSGADLTLETKPGGRSYALAGQVQPATVEGDGVATRFGRISIDAVQDRSEFSPGVGSIELSIESMRVDEGAAGAVTGFASLALRATSDLADGRVSGQTRLDIGELVSPEFGTSDLSLELVVDGVDAQALEAFVAAAKEAQAVNGANVAPGTPMPALEPRLRDVVAGGLSIRMPAFELSLPDGAVRADLDVDIAATDGAFSWPGVLLATTAGASLSVPVALYDGLAAEEPNLSMLVAMGYLKKNGPAYETSLKFAKGLLTVNGVPLPVPLGMPL